MNEAMFCRRLHDQAQRQGKYPDTSGNQVLNTERPTTGETTEKARVKQFQTLNARLRK